MKKVFLLLVAVTFMPASLLAAKGDLSGRVKVDGSSTVFPITEAMAEEFQQKKS